MWQWKWKQHEEEEVEDNLSRKLVEDYGEFDPTLELKNYQFPTLELLQDHNANGGGITIDQEELEENKNKIVDTLKNYKIEIAQIKATVGPTVLYMKLFRKQELEFPRSKAWKMISHFHFLPLELESLRQFPEKGPLVSKYQIKTRPWFP